jgi:methylmalonyl-CoA/ethylmalonyl-CoA epimerase
MRATLGTLRQISQPARDVDRAVGFYRDVLGLRLIARFGDLAFFDLDGVRLLVEKGEAPTTSVLYLAVGEIHAARRGLEAGGLAFEDEPHVIFTDADGTFGAAGEQEWMTFFRDTEGNLLALSARQAP